MDELQNLVRKFQAEQNTDSRLNLFETIFRRIEFQLYGFLKGLGAADPEDVLQEAAIIIYQRMDAYDCKAGRFISWCYTILQNKSTDWFRSKKRREKRCYDWAELQSIVNENTHENDHEEEAKLVVMTLLGQLGARCIRLLELHYFAEMTWKDVATNLNESEAAVTKAAHRCLQRLRQLFMKFYAKRIA